MFRVFAVVAWAVLLVILLYLWADVREIAGIVKENKRELLRSNLSGRAGETFPNFQEEAQQEKERRAAKEPASDGQAGKGAAAASAPRRFDPAEEQVLSEVLTEFLG